MKEPAMRRSCSRIFFRFPVAPPVPRPVMPIAWRKWLMECPSGMRQASSWVIFPSLRRPALATARVMI